MTSALPASPSLGTRRATVAPWPLAERFVELFAALAEALVDPVVRLEWHTAVSRPGDDVAALMGQLVATAIRAGQAARTGRDGGEAAGVSLAASLVRQRAVGPTRRRRRSGPLDDPDDLLAELTEARRQLEEALRGAAPGDQVSTARGALSLDHWLADRLVEVLLKLDAVDRAVGVRTPVSEATLRLAIEHTVAVACDRHGSRAILRALVDDSGSRFDRSL